MHLNQPLLSDPLTLVLNLKQKLALSSLADIEETPVAFDGRGYLPGADPPQAKIPLRR
jgi:hypothetical protein